MLSFVFYDSRVVLEGDFKSVGVTNYDHSV